ncbi:MAG: sulfatase, partial [Planctomycetota bacterium]|nr:sulfatase [Planctomycetota bacterium]
MMPLRAADRTSLLVAPLLGLSLACGGQAVEDRPNIVLISIDTLRPDHLGCYGYARPTSPNIDAIAAQGALFEQHISSAPWTLPAHAEMFTSVPDSVHGVVDAVKFRLSEDFETLPESFQAAGYSTAGFFAGPYLHPAFGLGQGFDRYVDCVQTVPEGQVDADNEWSMRDPVLRASHHGVTNDKVYAEWQRFFAEAAEEAEPFFAFVHLWDVHFDFTPPPPYDTLFDPDYDGPFTGRDFFYDPAINAAIPARDKEHIIALYDGEIAWTDEIVGRIRHDLGAAGLLENTVFVITADHGTELFDHGGKGHRTTLYDEQIHIPLIVHFPGVVQPARFAGQTRMIDLGPTLRDLAGLPAVSTTMGETLGPFLRGEQSTGLGRPAVSELMSVGRNPRSLRT